MEIVTYDAASKTVTIHGDLPSAPKTTFYDGEKAMQLSFAAQETTGFDWSAYEIEVVTGNGLVIFNVFDVAFLIGLINANIRLDFRDVYVMEGVASILVREALKCLPEKHIVKGSTLKTPMYTHEGPFSALNEACKRAGFDIV